MPNKLDDLLQKTEDNFLKYGSCAQVVLTSLKEIYPEISDATIKSAFLFGGGGVKSGEAFCGALSGGILAISNILGKENIKQPNKGNSLEIARELKKKFEEEFQVSSCNDVQKKLLGKKINLLDKKEIVEFKKLKNRKFCAKLCSFVVETVSNSI